MALLGHQIVSDILADKITNTNAPHVKGVYTEDRNFAIMCRLYYHYELKGLRYDKAINMVHKEFFLSETRITQLVVEGRADLTRFKAEKADKKYFAARFPHYNWN